jgi:hypothetical protein
MHTPKEVSQYSHCVTVSVHGAEKTVKAIFSIVISRVTKKSDTFVFLISLKSMEAQKQNYCQIQAEMLKFMWACGKSQFTQKITSLEQTYKT